MKYALVLVLAIQGLICGLGFAKAFDLMSLDQLREPISRPFGVLWLGAAVLFLVGAVLLAAASRWWWLPTAVALALSTMTIVASWGDAKFGLIVNLVVLVPVVVAALSVAPWSFATRYERDVAAGLSHAPAGVDVLTEADLAPLPEPVQRYLHHAGVVGRPKVWNYRVRFSGGIRNNPGDPWMSMTARQQSFTDPATRLFHITASRWGLPFDGYHRYTGDTATFQVRVAGLVPMVDDAGPALARAETVTLFNDMCLLAPATLIDDRITWREVGPREVEATFTNAGNIITATLIFDDSGALVDFVSDDRGRPEDYERLGIGEGQPLRWSTPIRGWQELDGRRLPTEGLAVWHWPGTDFDYGRLVIESVEYNVSAG